MSTSNASKPTSGPQGTKASARYETDDDDETFALCVIGPPGVGKSYFAADLPKTIFIRTENGMRDRARFKGIARTPIIKNGDDFEREMTFLENEPHDFKTAVLDSQDGLEAVMTAGICKRAGADSIVDGALGFGRGARRLERLWRDALIRFERLRYDRGMNIVFLGHASTTRFDDPDGDSYDRWRSNLNKATAPIIKHWVDDLLFAEFETYTQSRSKTDERKFGVSSGNRILRCKWTPAHDTKTRSQLVNEDHIPMKWSEYAKHINVKG